MIALDRLQQIIPQDQALANKALSVALQQIGGIENMTLPTLANATALIRPLNNLPLVMDQTQAVPPSVAQFYENMVANVGTGPGNSVVVSDVIGTAAGYNYTTPLTDTLTQFNNMDLSFLTLVYQTMLNVVNGVYGTSPVVIPVGTPGEGTYTSQDNAISTGLIPVAQAEITSLVGAYPTEVTALNQDWDTMGNQLLKEKSLQIQANLNFTTLTPNSQSAIYSFITALPSYGVPQLVGQSDWYLTSVADQSNFYGQSIIACLQQGSNQVALANAGILVNYNIPD